MCDTMVALGNSTGDGSVLFAKNSDRQPNEPLITIRNPRKRYQKGEKVKCTYIEIDQAEETYEVLLLKPSWIWGAEMGCNEFGLNIGNEAVFTREKCGPEKLLGMDLLRLALERCRSSEQALDLIIDLLARYGQGGNCGYEKKFTYHNSFLIADTCSAWVLETAGEYWAAEKVKDVKCISNRLTIGSRFDRSHPDLIKHAVQKGWCKDDSDFHFARCYSNPLMTRFSGSAQRLDISSSTLEREKGRIITATLRSILRSHEAGLEGRQFTRHSLKSVCMHGGFLFGDHTTGSYIATLNEKACTYLITGSSTPCIAVFKPYWMISSENFSFKEEAAQAAVEFWRKREKLHRHILENRIPDLAAYLAGRERLEEEIDQLIAALDFNAVGESRLQEIMDYALAAEEKLINQAMRGVKEKVKPAGIKGGLYFKSYWKKQTAALDKPRRRK
ncbi:MAG: peptidase U34 [Bacillota bacterium]